MSARDRGFTELLRRKPDLFRKLDTHEIEGWPRDVTCHVLKDADVGGADSVYVLQVTGGKTEPTVLDFQRGPTKEVGFNGLTNEVLLAVVVDRLDAFQAGPYPCDENFEAARHCKGVLTALKQRKARRITQGTAGTGKKVPVEDDQNDEPEEKPKSKPTKAAKKKGRK